MSDAADVSESIRACMQDMALTIQRQKAVVDAARALADSYDADEPWDADLAMNVRDAVRALEARDA